MNAVIRTAYATPTFSTPTSELTAIHAISAENTTATNWIILVRKNSSPFSGQLLKALERRSSNSFAGCISARSISSSPNVNESSVVTSTKPMSSSASSTSSSSRIAGSSGSSSCSAASSCSSCIISRICFASRPLLVHFSIRRWLMAPLISFSRNESTSLLAACATRPWETKGRRTCVAGDATWYWVWLADGKPNTSPAQARAPRAPARATQGVPGLRSVRCGTGGGE
mmetsp:Transcript_11856/g.21715  ORF Transcript_11856/g.21715 Transcript_11856/m.21715 type:complete len:228 (-) Transcript_11856:24-707(-)